MARKKLTPRQKQVAELAKGGATIAEIADKLGIRDTGVYGHMKRIRERGYEISVASNGNGGASAPEPKRTNTHAETFEHAFDTVREAIVGESVLLKGAEEQLHRLREEADECAASICRREARIAALKRAQEVFEADDTALLSQGIAA